MGKRTRIAIVISLIYELALFILLDMYGSIDEPVVWIIYSIPVIAYWLYKFIKSGEEVI